MNQEIQQILLMITMTALAIAAGCFLMYEVEKRAKKEK